MKTIIEKYPVWILCLASFVLAAVIAWWVYDAVPHLEDEHVNDFQAKVFAAGRIVNPERPGGDAFFIPFAVVNDGKQFSKYTPGYSLVLAPAMLIHQPWLINALAAALGILGTYLLGRELFDRESGLLAAALGTISPMYVLLSGTLLSHPFNLAVLVFFAWAFVRARRVAEPRRDAFALAAGLLMGAAMITRPWTSIAIGLPFAILALVDLIRNGRDFLPVYLRMAVPFGIVCTILPLYNLAATSSPFTNTYRLWWPYDTIGFGREIGRTGHTLAKAIINFKADFPPFGETLLGWPTVVGTVLTWLVIGLGVVLPPRKKEEWMLLVPPALLVLAHFAYWAHAGGLYGPRYYSEGMPFLWILAARGLLKFGSSGFRRRLVMAALPVMILGGIFFVTLPRSLQGHSLYNIDRQDYQTVEASGIQNAVVFVHSQYWTDYANLSWLNPADLEGADLIFVKDQGPQVNSQILQKYPGRKAYLYNRYQSQPLSEYPISVGAGS